MKRQIRLKWFITLVSLSLGIALVIGYSLLSANYFILGMDNMIASNMEQATLKYLKTTTAAEREQPSEYEGYPISRNWQQQPQEIQALFPHEPKENGVLYKEKNADELTTSRGIFFTMRWNLDGEVLFISHHLSRKITSSMVHRNITHSLDTLIVISITSAIALAIIFWLVLRRVSKPVAALSQWTSDLNPDTLKQSIPDFSYSELNELAELIRTSLSSVEESLDREHRFLRHTSHELRTPISVIRSNIDLMHKLQDIDHPLADPRQQQVIDRIDRASMTMKHLTETLLWLNRDESEKLPEQTIQLDKLIQQLVEETRYLLKDKAVEIDLYTEPCTITLPEVAARIVLGNLIRNAFQHTWKGKVQIYQQSNRVEINNIQSDAADDNVDLGFGLGMQLTAQLAARLNWDYENGAGPKGHGAKVTLGTQHQDRPSRKNNMDT